MSHHHCHPFKQFDESTAVVAAINYGWDGVKQGRIALTPSVDA